MERGDEAREGEATDEALLPDSHSSHSRWWRWSRHSEELKVVEAHAVIPILEAPLHAAALSSARGLGGRMKKSKGGEGKK